jgi:hypothetical protein
MITSQPRSLFARSIGFLIGRRHSTAAAQTAASQVSEQPWPQQAPSNEHLRFAPYFELAKAKKANDRFGMTHDLDGSAYVYSVGKTDWVPLAVAVMLLGSSSNDALDCVRGRTDKQQDSHEAFSDWVEANRGVFTHFRAYQAESRFDILNVTSEVDFAIHREEASPWPMQYDALSPTELSVMYRKAWKRFFAPVPEDFLAVSVAHATFYDMPEVQEMQVAVERVFAKVEVIARSWLQAQGFTLDHDLGLVRMEGYQPLVLCGSYAY